jgi:RNA polymerase I-specific transcription initiation factor RRN3
MDADADGRPPSPIKKPRVTFDPEVHVHVDEWEKSPDLLREAITRAVQMRQMGDASSYDRITEIFTRDPTASDAPSPSTLKNHVLAATSTVSLLDRSCYGFVNAILHSEWLGRDDDFVSIYIRFLGNLVSAQGTYVATVLSMLVGKFVNRMNLSGHPQANRATADPFQCHP